MNSNTVPSPATNLTEFALPSFARRKAEGLVLDLTALDSRQLFLGFLDRLFSSGFRLFNGDYALIQKVLYELTPKDLGDWAERLEGLGRAPEVRLAKDVVAFPDERRLFYRGWRPDPRHESAEYFFEPIFLERVVEEPVYGEPEPNGHIPVVRMEKRTVNEVQTLDLDEFYAVAWQYGVKFGWDTARIATEFARSGGQFKTAAKVALAQFIPPTAGTDASLAEQTDTLHRNDAPKVMRDGRVDLTQFKNRFPQVKQGTRLLKKIPAIQGVVGYDVAGEELQPDRPSDYSLDELAGPGTSIERKPEGEFVVAAIDGFLNIDSKTNLITVTEKIINREGVSVRTTGNLSLKGDEFEEHGEVQERRIVEGLNMTFMADVFGNVLSRGGKISLQKYLAGGSARSDGGFIEVLGGASRAVIEARGGEVVVKFAESTRIVGRKVTVERACLCEIVGDEVSVELAEGCAIAARQVRIGNSAQRKSSETTVVIPLPDLAEYDKSARESEKQLAETGSKIEALSARQQAVAATPELKTFLMVQKKRAAGEITMTPEQEAQFRVLATKAAPALKQMTELRGAVQTLQAQQAEVQMQAAVRQREKQQKLDGLSCEIGVVSGETVVRTRLPLAGELALDLMLQRDLQIRLRELGTNSKQIFSGNSGNFSWRWQDS